MSDQVELEQLYEEICERGGEGRVYELCKAVDLENANGGVLVSTTGLFPKNGGKLNEHCIKRQSLRLTYTDSLINANFKCKKFTYKIIRKYSNQQRGSMLFILWRKKVISSQARERVSLLNTMGTYMPI